MSTRELLERALEVIKLFAPGYGQLIEEIEAEIDKPETNQLIVKDVIKQKWKEGFDHGTKNIQSMYQEIEKTKNSYMDENEKLTNYILELENKIEELAKPEQETQYTPLSDNEILKIFDEFYFGILRTDDAVLSVARAIEKRIIK